MALNVGELVGYLSVDDSKWKSGLNKAQSDLGRVAKEGEQKASKAGALIGGAIGAGFLMAAMKAKQFAVGAVDAYAAVEDAHDAAAVVFGKSMPSVIAFAEKAGASFGLSKRAAIEAQNTFATFGKAAGIAGAPLAGFSQQLTGLAGDLASFKGTSTEQAIMAVGSALRGEMEPIRAYGVLLDDNTLRQEAMKMGMIKSVKEGLTPQQKALAAQAAILSQTKDAQGDYNRTSTSTANVAKTLAAETENAQAVLGKKLAPAVTAVRTAILGMMHGMGSAIDLTIKYKTPILVAAGVITAILIPAIVRMGVTSVVSGVKSLASFVMQGAKWVWLGVTATWNAAKIAAAWFVALGPIAWVIAGIAAVGAAVLYAYTHFKTFHNGVNVVINGVLKGFQYLTNGVIWGVNIMIKAWNLLPWHKDIKTLANVEFPQLTAAAVKAADGVHAALSKSGSLGKKGKSVSPGKPPVPSQASNLYDSLGLDTSGLKSASGASGAKKATSTLKKYAGTTTKIYGQMSSTIAAFAVSRAGLVKDAGLREIAAQTRFGETSVALRKNFDDDKFKLDRSYNEKLAAAQQNYDDATASGKAKHAETMIQIEREYNDKVTKLNQDAASKRQAIIQKSIDLLTGAFSSATSVDIGKMFSSGGGVTGLLASLKAKLFGARDLAKNAAALAAQGYTQTFIQQVVAQGPDVGNSMSKAILEATPEAAGELKNLFGAIQDVSDTGVTALATSMNSGASLATRALMAEYAQVGTELQTLLAQEYVQFNEANTKENLSFTAAMAASAEALAQAQTSAAAVYADSLFDMNTTLNDGLAAADKTLKDALLASSTQFNDDLDSLQKNSMAKMSALLSSLKAVAAQISAVSGAAAGAAVLGKAPSLDVKIPTVPRSTFIDNDRNSARKAGGLNVGTMVVNGFTPDDAVRKLGREMQWLMAGS